MSILNYKDKNGVKKQLSQLTIATITTQQIIDLVYPVGSYYWSANATSPKTIWGGMATNKR